MTARATLDVYRKYRAGCIVIRMTADAGKCGQDLGQPMSAEPQVGQ